jgi:cytochrome b
VVPAIKRGGSAQQFLVMKEWFMKSWFRLSLAVGLVVLHEAGVIWESRRHGENLVAAMITGVKRR